LIPVTLSGVWAMVVVMTYYLLESEELHERWKSSKNFPSGKNGQVIPVGFFFTLFKSIYAMQGFN
jgi:hypothetical protein